MNPATSGEVCRIFHASLSGAVLAWLSRITGTFAYRKRVENESTIPGEDTEAIELDADTSLAQANGDESEDMTEAAEASEAAEESEATEAIEAADIDPVALQAQRWAAQARQAPGSMALSDVDTVENLLDLTGAHPTGMAQLYGGRMTKLSSLVPDQTSLAATRALVKRIDAEKKSSVSRFGLYPTNLMVGVASWTQLPPFSEDERGTTPDYSHFKLQHFNMPVLLRSLELELSDSDYTLKMGGSLILNPVLVKTFQERKIPLDPDAIIGLTLTEDGFNFHPALEKIRRLGQDYIAGFDLKDHLMVANLGVFGAVLSTDWDTVSEFATENPLFRALAGDESAIKEIQSPLPSLEDTDRDPDLERGVGDQDISQARAVEIVASGRSVFVDVPPGAPGSETAAAILADCAASGKHVCFVPGVRRLGKAALDNLKHVGLNRFVLDLTGANEWRSALRSQLVNSEDSTEKTAPPVSMEELGTAHRKLRETREKLAAYTQRLHEVREPWGVSAYAALQALADLTSAKPGPRTKVKLNLGDATPARKEGREKARDLLQRAQASGLLEPELQSSPWKGVVLSTEVDAQYAISRVHKLADGRLNDLQKAVERTSDETGLVVASTLGVFKDQLEMLHGVAESLEIFQPEIFEESAADMVIATASARWRANRALPMKGRERRALVRRAKHMLQPGIVPRDLHGELVRVQQFRDMWRRYGIPNAWPRVPNGLETIEALAAEVCAEISALEPILMQATGKGISPDELSVSDLSILVSSLDETSQQALQMPQQVQLLKELREAGLEPLINDLHERQVPTKLALAELDLAWWSTILTEMLRSDPALAGIDGMALHELADTVRSLDLAQVESLPYPVAAALTDLANAAQRNNPEIAEEMHEILISGDLSALSDFDRYYDLVSRLCPIWALSPFLVAQLYGSKRIDVLVLDHLDFMSAEQVMPLVARAKQLVVLGDSQRGWMGFTQMAAQVLPKIELLSCQGELSEQVATFLAGHGYADTISPVPSPRPASLVSLQVVNDAQAPLSRDGSPVISRAEIQRVVELCLDHALNQSVQSLAVVCLNPDAVSRIRFALSDALVKVKEAREFFQSGGIEPFVVVDGATAAGLRRDVVILSLGMSKTPHGRVPLNFGPVSGLTGVAHVVGALAVVRQRLDIVSAFRVDEVDRSRIEDAGSNILLDLLAAAGNPEGMKRALTTPSSFEAEPDRLLVDLAERLWKLGLTVVPRFGIPGGIRVPLAIGHADLPSELLVAVLTDDEAYIREPSLRRRERMWPSRLEAAGWQVVTCYATEVFTNPQAQTERVLRMVEKALRDRQRALSLPIIATPHFELDNEVETGTNGTEDAEREESADTAAQPPAEESAGEAPTIPAPKLQAAGKPRGSRPPIAKGLPLAAYGDDQLDELLEWICSDGLDRSEDEQVVLLREELELSRRGAQVDIVLRHVVRRRQAAL